MATAKQLETLVAMAKERGLDPQPIYDDEVNGRLTYGRVDFLFNTLKAKPRLPKPTATSIVQGHGPVAAQAPAVLAEEGYYVQGGEYYKVMWNRAGTRRYARVLVLEFGKAHWYANGAKGMVYKLTEADRLTQEQAKAFGDLHHFCLCCGKELTVPLSIERGIGPVCWEKLGW